MANEKLRDDEVGSSVCMTDMKLRDDEREEVKLWGICCRRSMRSMG